jgi:orotidine-5'-phosphate decarboxylase
MCYHLLTMKVPQIVLALDGMSDAEALAMVDRIGPDLVVCKVGLELFTRYGPPLVDALREKGKEIFLDGKFHDIPATVAGAVRAASGLGVHLLTIHGCGGGEMMKAAVGARGEGGTKIVAVTVLTSVAGEGVQDRALRIAREAREAGLDGVVASAHEAARIKALGGPRFLVVTPGIRPEGAARDDQARSATPAEAARAGADYLVVGRPVTRADDPAAAFRNIREEARLARE